MAGVMPSLLPTLLLCATVISVAMPCRAWTAHDAARLRLRWCSTAAALPCWPSRRQTSPQTAHPWGAGSSTRLSMIGNLFGDGSSTSNSNSANLQKLPRDVKDAVSKCRAATQNALQQRRSRMTIDFPAGAQFGVEKANAKEQKNERPTLANWQRSDRELARLLVDMFQPVGGDHLSVVFGTAAQADAARLAWKHDSTAQCRIMSLDCRKTIKKKKASSKGFAAKMAAEVGDDDSGGGPFALPSGTEVALFVAPDGAREFAQVEKVCNAVGMGTLVILLNARLERQKLASASTTALFTETFDPVFCLSAAADQTAAPNGLLYRAYPGDWILARKPKVGPPQPVLQQPLRPTATECGDAFAALQLSDMERNMENVLDNVAGWFR